MKRILVKATIFILALVISLSCVLFMKSLNKTPELVIEPVRIQSPESSSLLLSNQKNINGCEEIDTYNIKFQNLITLTKKTIDGGVLNAKGCIIEPEFPTNIKAKRLYSDVLVEVLVSESGKVVKAKSVKGNQIFFNNAEKAALKSRFKHFMLGGESVRVKGFIRFYFAN